MIKSVIKSSKESNQIQERVNNSVIDINKPKDWSSKISAKSLCGNCLAFRIFIMRGLYWVDNIYRSAICIIPSLKRTEFQKMIFCNPHVFKKSEMVYLNTHSLTETALQGLIEQRMTPLQNKTIPEIIIIIDLINLKVSSLPVMMNPEL